MHGLLDASSTWVIMGPYNGLGEFELRKENNNLQEV